MHYLQITYADKEFNGFAECGGAGFKTQEEWEQQWSTIPESPLKDKDPDGLILDKLDTGMQRVDEKFITRQTAEQLLGKGYDQIIAEGRERTPYTIGEDEKRLNKKIL